MMLCKFSPISSYCNDVQKLVSTQSANISATTTCDMDKQLSTFFLVKYIGLGCAILMHDAHQYIFEFL